MKTLQSKLESYITNALKKPWDWFISLNAERRCYTIGSLFLIIAVIIWISRLSHAGFIANFGAVIFVLGLLPLIESTYEWLWRKLLGKLFIAALVALSTNMAYGVGRQLVASLVNTCPAQFSSTINIATILVSPLLFITAFALVGILIFVVAFLCGSVALMSILSMRAPNNRKLVALWMCRLSALTTLGFESMTLLTHSTGYADWVGRRATDYLFNFDMYHDPFYAKEKTEKVALLADGRVLVGSKPEDGTNIVFTIRQSLPNEHKDSTTESTRE